MDVSRAAEDGVRIIFGKEIDIEVHEKVRRYYYFVKSLRIPGVIDVIPSFRSCLIRFDCDRISFETLASILGEREGEAKDVQVPPPSVHEIPVRYGNNYGPDMDFICSYAGLDAQEVIDIHQSALYTVFAVGFLPGFPYLGPLDKRLYTPRLETPVLKVPAGSVGIAQLQTGIYPFESPAGWRILGRTDVPLFNPAAPPYSLMKIGDKVRFVRA